MSRHNLAVVLLCALAIGQRLSDSALHAQLTTADQIAVFNSSSWDNGNVLLASNTDEFDLPAFETPPVVTEGSELELNASEDSFDLQPQAMTYSGGSHERLIDRIVDPTAWLMNFRFRESWNWPTRGSDNEEFEFRPTIPFVAWDHVNILRVTIPYNVSGSDPGLDDVTILDLVVHEATWGRWGVGPVVRLTPGNGSDSFQIGPALGAVSKDRYWTLGFLTQNFFDDGVAETRIQPILAYKFDEQWAVGVGEFEFRYDWEDADWTQVPLGVEVDYITEIYGQKIQLFFNPQYNFESDASNSGWTVFLGLSLLVPEA